MGTLEGNSRVSAARTGRFLSLVQLHCPSQSKEASDFGAQRRVHWRRGGFLSKTNAALTHMAVQRALGGHDAQEPNTCRSREQRSSSNTTHVIRGAPGSLGTESRIHPNTVKCQNLKFVMNRAKGGLQESKYIARQSTRRLS